MFAEGHTFSRLSALFVNAVSARVRDGRSTEGDDCIRWAISDLVKKLRVAKPRLIEKGSSARPVVIFTDGACEGSEVTIGAVLFDDDFGPPEHFGYRVPERVWNGWKSKASQLQVIGQAEIAPVIIAKLTWADRIRNRKVIVFIDNEAARIGLVRSYSPSLPSLKLIGQSIDLDILSSTSCWYARVPTLANPADLPSRLQPSEYLKAIGAIGIDPCLPAW